MKRAWSDLCLKRGTLEILHAGRVEADRTRPSERTRSGRRRAARYSSETRVRTRVTEGLLALDLNDDELAGVLAHEVAHGCRRDIEVHAATWGEQQDFATAGEFQKQVEIDADQRGLLYATDAEYSAYGLMSVLKKLAEQNAKTFGKAAYRGGHTHPSLEQRIATLREVLAGWPKD